MPPAELTGCWPFSIDAVGRHDGWQTKFRVTGFEFWVHLNLKLETRNLKLLFRVRRAAARRGYHRRALKQAFVDENLDLDATVLRATFAGVIVRDRIRFTVAERRDDAGIL